MKSSLYSNLQVYSVCSIRNRVRKEGNFEKPKQLNLNLSVSVLKLRCQNRTWKKRKSVRSVWSSQLTMHQSRLVVVTFSAVNVLSPGRRRKASAPCARPNLGRVAHFAIFEKLIFCDNFQNVENYNGTYSESLQLRVLAIFTLYMFHQKSQYSRSYRKNEFFENRKKLTLACSGSMKS